MSRIFEVDGYSIRVSKIKDSFTATCGAWVVGKQRPGSDFVLISNDVPSLMEDAARSALGYVCRFCPDGV